jgi:hypothetical protein
MPTNDITNVAGDDWSSQFMNWLRGQGGAPAGGAAQPPPGVMPNFGAAAPYDQAANPVFPPGSDVPGGGMLDYSAATPGQPSMGYPARNQGAPPAQRPYGGMPFPQNTAVSPQMSMPAPPVGGPQNMNMPYPGQIDPRGVWAPRAGGPPQSAPATAAPAGTATAAPAAPRSVAPAPVVHTPGAPNLGYYPPNPRFGTMQSQVPSGRGPLGNNPIYTTMNLFGGGQQPAAAPAAAAPAAQGAAVPRTYPGEGWDVDAQGNPIPSYGNPLADPTQTNPTALASAVSQPNWWQKLGRPDMNPNQLASAVRKPNWWQNV